MRLNLVVPPPTVRAPDPPSPPSPDEALLKHCAEHFIEACFQLGTDQAEESHVFVHLFDEGTVKRECKYVHGVDQLYACMAHFRSQLAEEGYGVRGVRMDAWDSGFLVENPFLTMPAGFRPVYEARKEELLAELQDWANRNFDRPVVRGHQTYITAPTVFKEVLVAAQDAFLAQGYRADVRPANRYAHAPTELNLVVTVP